MHVRSLVVVLVGLSGCVGFRAVERGEWRRVWAQSESKHTQTSAQALITREAYEEELANSMRRNWEPPPGWVAPWLGDSGPIAMTRGEVLQFRVDEAEPVELQVQGSAVKVHWNPAVKRDEWKAGEDQTHRESDVFLEARGEGQATVRVIAAGVSREIPVSVTP